MIQSASATPITGDQEKVPAAPATGDGAHHAGMAALTLGAIGVVFGDIGTSPLYAFHEALGQASAHGLVAEAIVGVESLTLWALILIVTVKYVLFLMRADNDGEGGVLALLALARRGVGTSGGVVLSLGALGAALFYGDAMITPSLSVLSAVEGLKTLPAFGPHFSENHILEISLTILVALFAIQSRGTAAVSTLFGPICVVWFVAIASIGLIHIPDAPGILAAFLPWHAVLFVANHGVLGLFVLGAVFLTVTGAEALTADMGHFGVRPIRLAWFALVFPALMLNYLGQGAFAMKTLAADTAAGQPFANLDWFFITIPDAVRLPMVLLATMATIIASQAVITGAFSLTQQAIQLGLLPRMDIKQTSAGHSGQIYIGMVNWAVLFGVVALALGFRNSSAMAAAYGIAVTGTMVITCCLAYIVVRRRWGWSLGLGLAVIIPFLAIDLLFFGANILRVVEGGWVPLTIAGLLLVVIWTWHRGRLIVSATESEGLVPLADMAAALAKRPPARVEGIAIFLTAHGDLTPHALLHNLKHNHVLHRHNYVTTVRTLQKPFCDPGERMKIVPVDDNFSQLEMSYGFMERPALRDDLVAARDRIPGVERASFFIGRNNFAMSGTSKMPMWQAILFTALYRNAANPTDWYNIPANRVIELGAQYTI